MYVCVCLLVRYVFSVMLSRRVQKTILPTVSTVYMMSKPSGSYLQILIIFEDAIH